MADVKTWFYLFLVIGLAAKGLADVKGEFTLSFKSLYYYRFHWLSNSLVIEAISLPPKSTFFIFY